MSFIKKTTFVVVFLLLSQIAAYGFDSLDEGLSGKYRSMNFEVAAPDKPKAKTVCLACEKYYKELLKRLRYGGMLDEKCRVYVYEDHQDYLRGLQAAGINVPEWSGGCHMPRRYYSYGYPVVCGFVDKNFLDVVLPHELTHAIFAEFVYGRQVEEERVKPLPLWLNEGMAVYMQKESDYKALCLQAIKNNAFISVGELINMDNYPAEDLKLTYFYAQSPSLVEYLLNVYGGHKFLSLAKKSVFRSDSMEDLLKSVYYGKICDLTELENNWINYIKENY